MPEPTTPVTAHGAAPTPAEPDGASETHAPNSSSATLADSSLAPKFAAHAARIVAAEDQVLFSEAVRCVGAEALRAAYLMTWISAAESLKRKFRELAERDKSAAAVMQKVTHAEERHQAVDITLLNEAKSYGFVSDAEHAQLEHVYQMRSVFAHPYEQAPTPEALLAAARLVVDAVLSRTTKLRQGYIAERVKLLAGDPNFLDDVRGPVAEFATEMFGRVADELHPYVLLKLWEALTPKVADPSADALVRRGRRFTLTYLQAGGEELVRRIEWSAVLPPHARLVGPVLADPTLFPHLPKIARDMVVGHVLDLAAANAAYFPLFDPLIEAGQLDARQTERVQTALDAVTLDDLAATAVAPARYADRLIADFKKHNWYVQNDAVAVLRNIGPERIAQLSPAVQHELGNNVLQAADGSARAAEALMRELASESVDDVWPPNFLAGVVAECFVNDAGAVRFKTDWLEEALLSLRHAPEEARHAILERLARAVRDGPLQPAPFWAPYDFDAILATIDGVTDASVRDTPGMDALRQAITELRDRALEDEGDTPSN